MNGFLWSLQPPHARRDSGPHEIEMLQTDVMRFMAIIGLVLMAIFALIQSLQVGPTDPRPKLEDPVQLAQEAAKLKQKIHQLRQQLVETEARLNQVRQETQQAMRLQEQAALQAQQADDLRAIQTRQAEKTRKEWAQVARSLQQARRALVEQEQQLAVLNQQIQQRQRSLIELRREIAIQNRALAAIEQKLAALDNTLPKSPSQAPEAPVPEAPTPGFNLHFASEEALTFLVRTQQVKLYAMLGKRAWQLKSNSRSDDFQASSLPTQFYEMDPQTVPQNYLLAVKKKVTALDALELTWGVILPQRTRNQISRLMSQHSGGELVIQKNSTVTFVPVNQ